MTNESKIYITAPEMATLLGISIGHAYKMVREMNKELEKIGLLGHCWESAKWLL